MMGQMYMQSASSGGKKGGKNAWIKALGHFKKLRDTCSEDLDYYTKCYAYSKMAKCYQALSQYKLAIFSLKK